MKRHFVMLDGCRGLAAIMVALSHAAEWSHTPVPPFAFLALDFFFMLSGFVVCFAYEDRLISSMAMVDFIRVRVRRLHPLLIFGTIAGAFRVLASSVDQGWADVAYIFALLVLGILMIPFHPAPDGGFEPHDIAFPLNGPIWSMFAEYGVNFAYAAIAKRLSKFALTAIILVSGLTLVPLAYHFRTLSFGFQQGQILFALVRVCCPFFIGVALCRAYRAGYFDRARLPLLTPCILLIIVLAMPQIVPIVPYALLCDFFILPLVIVAGVVSDPGREIKNSAMPLLGRLSYPLYVIHTPVLLLLAPAALWVPQAARFMFAVIIVIIAAFVAHFVERYIDQPIRRRWAKAEY